MTILLVGSYKNFDSNEYVQLLADAYIKQGIQLIFEEQNFLFSNFIPDVIHIQWPESIYRWKKLIPMDETGLSTIKNKLAWYKKNKVKIVYTVHNLQPHDESFEFDKEVYKSFFKHSDIIVHHGQNSIKQIKDTYKETINSTHIVAPHGSYPIQMLPQRDLTKKKYDIPLDKITFTNFGLQRSYKGRNFNLEVFKTFGSKDICYFTAGRLVGDTQAFKVSQKELCNRQIYKKMSLEELVEIISATDIFFLGHSSGLNSGLIPLALSYSKPIIFPDIGNFKEQAEGFDFYETYEVGNINSAQKAIRAMIHKMNEQKTLSNDKWLKLHSWDNHANIILKELKND